MAMTAPTGSGPAKRSAPRGLRPSVRGHGLTDERGRRGRRSTGAATQPPGVSRLSTARPTGRLRRTARGADEPAPPACRCHRRVRLIRCRSHERRASGRSGCRPRRSTARATSPPQSRPTRTPWSTTSALPTRETASATSATGRDDSTTVVAADGIAMRCTGSSARRRSGTRARSARCTRPAGRPSEVRSAITRLSGTVPNVIAMRESTADFPPPGWAVITSGSPGSPPM